MGHASDGSDRSDLSDVRPTARVERLREHALARALDESGAWNDEPALEAARSWLRNAAEPYHIVRRGTLARDILTNLTPVVDDDELLVGKFSCRTLSDEERRELAEWQRTGQPAMMRADGQRAHMAIDYDRLLRLGVSGVRALIERHRARLSPERAGDLEADAFYRACLVALDGVVELSNRYANLAEEQARTASDARREELLAIARVCRKVPEQPAETFREAAQAVHFATFCMCAGNRMLLMQLGRPDRYLLPFYERDLAAGRLTEDEAQEIVDCLGILLNEYTPRGLAVGWMVGGRDEHGRDVTNPLTYLMVRAAGHIRLAYPGIGLCWTADTPQGLMDLACRTLATGCSHPALFGDDVITRGLLNLGLPHRDACLYIHSTCVEITPVAISNVYVASPYYNLIQALHEALETDEPPTTFPEVLSRWKTRMRALIRDGVAEQNRCMMSRHQAGGFPLLSCFVNDCLALGKDIDHGGARANWIESSFVGLANLVDALAAIRALVYEKGALTLGRMVAASRDDYVGHDDVAALVRQAPRYGNDDDRADELAIEITEFLRDECEKHRTYWGGPIVPGLFCWIMHEHFGRHTGATFDGRRCGFPLADGSGPAQGREKCGPTAMVRSVTKWDHSPMIGGIAVNMRFQPGRDRRRLARAMRDVLTTFLTLGGFEAQVNVLDAATLADAHAHPERHADLVVRVAGYSDYFVMLSPEMQAEVMARTELELQ